MGRSHARLVAFIAAVAGAVAIQSCAPAASPGGGETAAVPPPHPEAEPPAAEPFQASAPDEIVSEATLSARRFIVGDLMRLGIVEAVEQGPRGVLRTAVGRAFDTGGRPEFHYSKLASAYFGWSEPGTPLVIELWERGRKLGEYVDGAFLLGPGHDAARDCAAPGAAGICGYAAGVVPPPEAPAPGEGPEDTAARDLAGAPRQPRAHGGFHAVLGAGGGSVGLSCDGCDFARQTALSGYLSLAAGVADNTLVGVEGTGWTDSESGSTAQVYSVMATATRYLNARSGLFACGGLGLIGYRQDTDLGDITATAPGFAARVGYELGIGPDVALVPYAAFVGTFGRTRFEIDGRYVGRDFSINNLQFGMGLGIH